MENETHGRYANERHGRRRIANNFGSTFVFDSPVCVKQTLGRTNAAPGLMDPLADESNCRKFPHNFVP
jgi:hypothetical protein